jgi:threonine dehydratase
MPFSHHVSLCVCHRQDIADDAIYISLTGPRCPFVEDGPDAAISEGAGTIAVELAKYQSPIDVVYVPVGNGALASRVGA